MQRWIWIVVALGVSTSVYFTIRYGLRPKAIPVLNPTSFEKWEEIGVVMYKRLRQNIRTERVVLLGSSEDVKESDQIWLGLLRAAHADREKLVVFYRQGTALLNADQLADSATFDEPALLDGKLVEDVRKRLKAGQLVVVRGLTREVTHLVDGSLSRQLDKAVRHPVLSISTMPLAINKTEQDNLQPQCLDASEDPTGLRRLGCAAQKVARKFAKKKLSPEKIWAVAERHGLKEYLVFVYEPTITPDVPAAVGQ